MDKPRHSTPSLTDGHIITDVVLDILPSTLCSQQIEISKQTSLIDCPICFNSCPSQDLRTPFSCKHSFCTDCLKGYLESRMKSFKVLQIACPMAGCPEVFSHEAIESIIGEEQYKHFHDLVLKKVANRDLTNRFCPKPGCSRNFSPKKGENFTVCVCQTKICNVCHNFWHNGKTCLEVLDPEFELYSKDNDIRFCVMCKTLVKREEGCRHIVCPVCDYEWCWACGREYTTFHNCPLYWSPTAPSEYKESFLSMKYLKRVWRNSSFAAKISLLLLAVLLSPLWMILFLIFWPLYLYADLGVDLSSKKPLRAAGVILQSMVIGIVALPFSLFYLLSVFAMFIFMLPWMLVKSIVDCVRGKADPKSTEEKTEDKRWKTGDVKNFTLKLQPNQQGVTLATAGLENLEMDHEVFSVLTQVNERKITTQETVLPII